MLLTICKNICLQHFILKVRAGDFGKRVTPIAALKIQRDLLDENLISEREILTRISAKQLRWFQSKTAVISTENATPIARGKVITCGSVAGQLAFTPHECRSMTTPILCVKEFDYRIHSDAFKNAAGIIKIAENSNVVEIDWRRAHDKLNSSLL